MAALRHALELLVRMMKILRETIQFGGVKSAAHFRCMTSIILFQRRLSRSAIFYVLMRRVRSLVWFVFVSRLSCTLWEIDARTLRAAFDAASSRNAPSQKFDEYYRKALSCYESFGKDLIGIQISSKLFLSAVWAPASMRVQNFIKYQGINLSLKYVQKV